MNNKKVLAVLLTASMVLSPVQSLYVLGAEADIFSDGENVISEEPAKTEIHPETGAEGVTLLGDNSEELTVPETEDEMDIFSAGEVSEEETAELFADETAIPTQIASGTGINVEYHTQAEIKAMADTVDPYKKDGFAVNPSESQPYNPGKLDDSTVQNTLNTLNLVRYIAGIPHNVQIDPKYEEQAQARKISEYVE